MLAFCEAVFWRSAFATRCWFSSEAAWDGRAFNGNGDAQCWPSLRLLCRGTSARRSFLIGPPHGPCNSEDAAAAILNRPMFLEPGKEPGKLPRGPGGLKRACPEKAVLRVFLTFSRCGGYP